MGAGGIAGGAVGLCLHSAGGIGIAGRGEYMQGGTGGGDGGRAAGDLVGSDRCYLFLYSPLLKISNMVLYWIACLVASQSSTLKMLIGERK